MTPSVLKLTVIVPTRNRRDVLLGRTLPAMARQTMPPDQFEVIVVVDGATDGTGEALRELAHPWLRTVEQANGGPSVARNAAIRLAKGDVVLFIDDDILCAEDLFQQHAEAHAGRAPSVVFGRLAIAPESPPSVLHYANKAWYAQYYAKIDSQNGLRLPQNDYLISNSSMPRGTLLECGGFDEAMSAKEDYELALRLWKMGLPFVYLPRAQAWEYFQKPIQYVMRKDGEAFGATDVLLSRKHSEYRPCSTSAGLAKISAWKILWRRAVAALPFNAVRVLNPPLRLCDRLCQFPAMRKISRRLLGAGRSVTEFRGAMRQAGSWPVLESEFAARLPVLLYHHVGPDRPGAMRGLTVSAERFERHIRRLAESGYHGICPADWLRWRREGKGLPEKPVLITFDDGYEDLVEHAFPVLRRYGFGAAVYIVTRQLGRTNAWDEARGWGTLRLMTAEQVQHWATQGIEFGAHSRTHADLTSLNAPELQEEVNGSAADMEQLLGVRPVSFAYPYGLHNQKVDDCVRGAFELAFIADDNDEGLNTLATDPHLLVRTMVQREDSAFAVAWRARRGRYPLFNLWNRIRIRLGLRTRLRRGMANMAARGGD
jgi:glycosyltransferase involved in cell wall biosynthesis/peptidoglycan/xylan/chitin deacetylase (PgdA/CDA1 family)